MVSVVLPTYNEAENIPLIIPKIFEVFRKAQIDGEVIVVDDSSPDGTADAARKLIQSYPLRVHVRKEERGLATAVIKGFELARGDICVVMDADLSHPVDRLPALIESILADEADIAVGSRLVEGGGSDEWPLLRKMVSRGAQLLAIGLTSIKDTTSGFMAVRRDLVNKLSLDPVGWKIVLETVVKADFARVVEVPIIFTDRERGQSKLGLREQLDYVRHLVKLYCFKFPGIVQFIKFCLVGASGVIVDTAVLVSLVELFSLDPRIAAVFAFFSAVTWNYHFNKSWTFSAQKIAGIRRYLSFVTICILGLGVRIGVMHILIEYGGMGVGNLYVVASLLGILAATIFNFLGSRYIVFAQKLPFVDRAAKLFGK